MRNIQNLLDVNDPDWVAFQNGDPEYLMRAAGETIREYCGWHIYPNITVTLDKLKIGTEGRIMLPSLMVTDVSSLAIQFNPQQPFQVQDPGMYSWFEEGYILPVGQAFWGSSWYSGYYYEPGPYFLPSTNVGLASVTFNSGYDYVPEMVKQVAFEMAQSSGAALPVGNPAAAGALPSSTNVKEIASPGFRLVLNGDPTEIAGSGTVGSLTTNQKNRLADYMLGRVI